MKLIFCSHCYDVFSLVSTEWRMCSCQGAGGQYNRDMVTATIGGECVRVFGIGNPFFQPSWRSYTEEQRIAIREANNYREPHDCWWGEYPGDNQLFKIESATGPRLRIKVIDYPPNTQKIVIIDEREYVIDGQVGVKEVVVPMGVGEQEEDEHEYD